MCIRAFVGYAKPEGSTAKGAVWPNCASIGITARISNSNAWRSQYLLVFSVFQVLTLSHWLAIAHICLFQGCWLKGNHKILQTEAFQDWRLRSWHYGKHKGRLRGAVRMAADWQPIWSHIPVWLGFRSSSRHPLNYDPISIYNPLSFPPLWIK